MPKNKKKNSRKKIKKTVKSKKIFKKDNLKLKKEIKVLNEKSKIVLSEKQNIKTQNEDIKIELPEKLLKGENKIKPKREKKHKGIVIRILCIMFLTILIGIIIFPRQKEKDIKFKIIGFNEYMDLYTKKSLEYIFIIDEKCKNCDVSRKNLQRLKNEFSVEINELNIQSLEKDDIIKLQDSNSALKDNINVPILLSIKDGKEIGQISATKEYSALKKFVSYSTNPNEINSFNKITINKYLSLLKSEDITIIYIGDSVNSECKNFSSILEGVSQELDFKVNYLDTNNITKSQDWDKLNSSNKIFGKNWFMPVILIIKKGNIVSYKMESMDKDALLDFFERYGL